MRPESRTRRHTARIARVVLAGLLAGSMMAAPASPVALAADPPAGTGRIRLVDETDRPLATHRPPRSVTVSELSQAIGPTVESQPRLAPGVHAVPAPADTLGGSAPVPVLATTSGTPPATETTAFAGLARTTIEPPSPWVAVGPDHVIQAVNTTFRITDRSGASSHDVSMFTFFGLSALKSRPSGPYQAEVANPRVIWDSLQGRWVAIQSSFDCYPAPPDPNDPHNPGADIGTGFIDVAISRTADARGTWDVISLGFPDMYPDFPGLGTSTDKVVASANVYELIDGGGANGCRVGPTLLGSELDVMAWSELKFGGLAHIDYHFTDFAPGSSFPNEYLSWRPALQGPATSPTVYLIAQQLDGGVAYAELTGSPITPGLAPLTITDLTAEGIVAGFADPPQPRQPGSPGVIANAVDARPTDAVWHDSRLAFVSTYPCDPADAATEIRACVRVTELATTTGAPPTLSQDFLIATNARDNYMGGIGFAQNGDLHVVWTRSSAAAGDHPSAYTAMQLASDAPNTLGERQRIAAGTGRYPGTRWGEYVGVAQDPQVPNAVWQGNQYSTGTGWWGTHISQLQTGGSSYVPIAPFRIVDSRTPTGVTGIFNANAPRTFQVAGTGGPGGIPADAIAVTGNVTIVDQSAAGYVSVTPEATSSPTSSTINFPTGDHRANNFTVPLNGSGRLAAVYKAPAGRSTHLVVDITGYFVAGSADATYTAITPVRALDTRPGTEIGLSGAFQPSVPRKLQVGGTNGIPVDAVAITGNLTVVGQTRAGYLSVTKTSIADPATSTLNFPRGDTRANGISVPLNASGALWIVYKASGGSTDVILDVTGYYRDAPSGLLFYPLNPGRTLDSRPGTVLSGLAGSFAASGPRRLQVGGHWGVPAGASAISGNLTVVGQNGAGYVSATLAEDATPSTSALNFPLGDIRANGVTLPLNGGGRTWLVYKAPSGSSTHLILDVTGYFE